MSAFKTFYAEHRERFFAYLMRLTGDYHQAGDVMQESFTRYLERYGDERPEAALLYTIGRHLVFDETRKRRRWFSNPSGLEPTDDRQEQRLLVRDEYRHMLAAMQRLDPEERDLLALAVSRDLVYREIAAICGISEANVKVKIHRARVKLKHMLQAGHHERPSDQPVHR